MTDIPRQNFEEIVQELTRFGNSRTWSILVTIFGELAQNQNDGISGQLLSSLTQLIGIKPQAVRVALHRLRRDGWIVTEKSGRTSKHRLSEFGLNQSMIAIPRIYAKAVEMPEKWHVLITNTGVQDVEKHLITQGYRSILQGVYLGKGGGPEGTTDFLILEGQLSEIPDWLRSAIADTATVEEYGTLAHSLDLVTKALENDYTPTPMEAVMIRTLIVHSWRRIVLRQPDLSLELLPSNQTGQCRLKVWDLLEKLERPSIGSLETIAN